jgi:hypothetical protein
VTKTKRLSDFLAWPWTLTYLYSDAFAPRIWYCWYRWYHFGGRYRTPQLVLSSVHCYQERTTVGNRLAGEGAA